MFKLFKRSLAVYTTICSLVGTLVVGMLAGWISIQAVGWVFLSKVDAGVQIVGNPPTQEFVEWVNTLPKTSYSGHVKWDGQLIFDDQTEGAKSFISSRCAIVNSKDCDILIENVTVFSGFDDATARWLVRAETVGRYSVFEWWLKNQGYISPYDPEFLSWGDGMGYLTVGMEKQEHYSLPHPLSYWDGYSQPTCAHLLAIQDLYKADLVSGTGIENLLERVGCN